MPSMIGGRTSSSHHVIAPLRHGEIPDGVGESAHSRRFVDLGARQCHRG
ncbi:hypothetical protein AB0J89_03605 [Micromonospora chokoriensis]